MTDTTDTNQETYEGRCARLEAELHLAQDPYPFTTLVNEGQDKAGTISAIADILGDLCSGGNPNQLNEESVERLMFHVLNSADRLDEILNELHDLYRQQGKSVQPDAPDTPDALNAEANGEQAGDSAKASRTPDDVDEALRRECKFIKATADVLFTFDNTCYGEIDSALGLVKGTTSTMTANVMDAADRVEALLGEYDRLLRADHESKPATSG